MNLMKIFRLLSLFFSMISLCGFACADNKIKSGKTAIYDNPFVAIAKNIKNKTITGYVAALRTSPDRTDECKFVFRGEINKTGSANLLIANAVMDSEDLSIASESLSHGFLKSDENGNAIIIDQISSLGNCDWILGFIGEPKVVKNKKQFHIYFDMEENGDWIGINAIRSKRAYFYSSPNAKRALKSFLVAGDVVYIYDENIEWYYVKYKSGKKETTGWIRKIDTVQF